MELNPGTRLGPYEVLDPLGAGGMGQVFRARDVKLDRLVALKVLRGPSADDPAWLARFGREARLLASLSHPNIATLHGLDEVDGLHYLVMELVPGQTLTKRLAAGRLPPDEALAVVKQIAEALEAAHERGIIHRDLKPANVMLTPDGKVKVLDFGLAKSTEPAETVGDSSAPREAQTEEGVIVGTPAYMAPEQARGKPLDRRCDVWALGCVLFEALVGRPAFRGTTFHDTLASVIEGSPPWQELPAGLPPRLTELLRRCLQKDPQKRLRDAGDIRLELDEVAAELVAATTVVTPPSKLPGPPPAAAEPTGPARRWWPAAAVVAAVLAAFALGRWWPSSPGPGPAPAPAPGPAPVWTGQLLLRASAPAFLPRVSPDGKWLAFLVVHEEQGQVGVMKLDSGEWWVLTRSRDRGQVNNISWARDSKRLYFDRFTDVPAGVFSASPLDRGPEGAREVLVVKDADNPHVLADKTLLVCKLDAAGNYQLYQHVEGKPLRAVGPPVEFERGWLAPVRALHTRDEIVFCAKVRDGKAAPVRRLYRLNVGANEYRPFSEVAVGSDFLPLAVSWRDEFLYTVLPAEDSFHVSRIPLDGEAVAQPLLTLRAETYGMDVDTEGRLYLDQTQRPLEVLRFGLPDGKEGPLKVERLAGPLVGRETASVGHPVQLPDGRLVLPSRVAGRARLVAALPGRDGAPLLHDSSEETDLPAVLLGKDRLAFMVGSGDRRRLRIATLEDGTFHLEPAAPGLDVREPDALAGSPDGKTLYFVQDREVYQVPVDGSRAPQKVAPGDGVAVDPRDGSLVIQWFDGSGARLSRVARPGEPAREVPVAPGPLRPAPVPLAAGAVGPDGRILVPTASKDHVFWRSAVLGPDGKLQPLPADFDGDVIPSAWGKDGKVLGMGYSLHGELWRFTRH